MSRSSMCSSRIILSASLGLVLALLSPSAIGSQSTTIEDNGCSRSDVSSRPQSQTRSAFTEAQPDLDAFDEIAALEAVHVALSEVGDGSSYVWYRHNGRLSGVIQPTVSFKDASGKVCRHLVLELSSGALSKRIEGIACRLDSGTWELNG